MAEQEYLDKKLFEESLPVTFRLLSRELNVNANTAKSWLAAFYQSHQNQILPSYLLAGTKKRSPHLISITVVPDSSSENIPKTAKEVESLLTSTKETYETIKSCHIYSLSPVSVPLTITEIITGTEATISEKFNINECRDKLETWGVIKNPDPLPDFSAVSKKKKNMTTVSNNLKKEAPVKKEAPSTVKKTFDTGLTTKYVSRKQAAGSNNNNSSNSKNNVISSMKSSMRDTNRSKTDPLPAKKTSKPAPTNTTISKPASSSSASSGYKYVSRKDEKSKPKEKVIVSENHVKSEIKQDEEDVDLSAVKARKAKEEIQRKELEQMFNDDDADDFGDDLDEGDIVEIKEDAGEKKKEVIDSTPITINSTSIKEKEIISVKTQTQDETISQLNELVNDEDDEKIESYVDEDGYMVSTRKMKPTKPKKAPSPPTAKPKARTLNSSGPAKKQKQSTIMSFFNKK
ncbi:hypothetical protein DASC09_054990 [Saccharomycopsis crataegensis]|uniref:DNA polymerase delta subunit 3 n=1 Tax=Saccharomycopsis crataegensis TaxID=43959 RepID=A0AAV5QUA1_9ASCO|nr:hypothetical protein DASC09_054990 [Saccharomycopsis crataegensis]